MPSNFQVTGRFAPSPSGPLHFGSLVTAVASFCHVKSQNGLWLLRMEDIDTPRVVKGSADNILNCLEVFGFEWDGEVLYQSQRFEVYEEILQQLKKQNYLYGCDCSRKYILESSHRSGPMGIIYPGYCRHKKLLSKTIKLRLKLRPEEPIEFNDVHYGHNSLNLEQQVGDIVLKRSDGIYAYHLAVVVDDAFQNITQIVRGADLLQSTNLHIYLNKILGLTTAEYLHIPLIKNKNGDKLSKQTGAEGLNIDQASNQLVRSLNILGQDIPEEFNHYKPDEILQYATQHWDITKIPPDFSCHEPCKHRAHHD